MPKMACEREVQRVDQFQRRKEKAEDPFGLEDDDGHSDEEERASKFSAEAFADMDRSRERSPSPPVNEFAAGSDSDDLDWSKGIGIENSAGGGSGGAIDDFVPDGGGGMDDFNPGGSAEDFLKF